MIQSDYRHTELLTYLGVKKEKIPRNLPRMLTPFIGRDSELHDISEILKTSKLSTLVGSGGIGKTRIALRVAEDRITSFLHGVFFVPLASVSSSETIISRTGEVLGLTFSGKTDPVNALSE